jgi:hypothetical protein
MHTAEGMARDMHAHMAVLPPLTLPALLDHVLASQSSSSSTTLLVCCPRDAFVRHLAAHAAHARLLAPTLDNLLSTRRVTLAFCPSVQALLAYLAVYDRPGYIHVDESDGRERLVLVNPLALHAHTPAFSAQGLSRTFAAAADTATRTGALLQLVECLGQLGVSGQDMGDDVGDDMDIDVGMDTTHGEDPWEQQVSILNVSAPRFGSAADQAALAGRTVTARAIASRWFRFLAAS